MHSIACCAFVPVWFYPKSLTFKSWVMIVGKNTHSKINKDNCSSYQTQIMALSPVGRVQQKPPSPTSALQSISLSDCCCCHLSLPSVWLLQLSCWLVFVHALLPICQMSVKNLSSNQPALLYVCQSLFLPQTPCTPRNPAPFTAASPFHSETFSSFMVRHTQSGNGPWFQSGYTFPPSYPSICLCICLSKSQNK